MAIKMIINHTDSTVEAQSEEWPDHSGNSVRVAPHTQGNCDMWTPWCNNQADFDHSHRISLKIDGAVKYWIWEQSGFIRSNPGGFENGAPPISGNANSGGAGKILIVNGDASLSITDSP